MPFKKINAQEEINKRIENDEKSKKGIRVN